MKLDELKINLILKNRSYKLLYDAILEFMSEDDLLKIMYKCDEEELFNVYGAYGNYEILIGNTNNIYYLAYITTNKREPWKLLWITIVREEYIKQIEHKYGKNNIEDIIN